jgi:chromatin segregation and condensation protein Rec8/ScpA/Scc1 (kleisin family)
LIKYSELSDLALEATQNDGRLARRPLKSRSKEIQAHQILSLRITQIMEDYNAAIKVKTLIVFTLLFSWTINTLPWFAFKIYELSVASSFML